jgi:nucleoside-diphosphate-sugar epimerase
MQGFGMPQTCLITGATGFVGSHVAMACAPRGMNLRTIARATSDTKLLDELGVKVFRGDITEPAVVAAAMDSVDIVVHCAAKVGDWGPVDEYRKVNVEGLRNLLDAAKGQSLERFVDVSTLGVYAARHHHGTDETVPPPEHHMDGYTQSKVEAEQLALRYEREFGVPVVVLRPGFVYGPRDRTVMPRLIESLRNGQFRYLGGGERAMNTIFVDNLVDAIGLAIQSQQAVGQIYNLTDGEFVSKRKFVEAIAEGMEIPAPRRSLPLWVARPVMKLLYFLHRKSSKPPRLTHARYKFLGLNLDFSIEKARRELGYHPRVPFEDAIKSTMAWYRQNAADAA